jgi:hypothetical protein
MIRSIAENKDAVTRQSFEKPIIKGDTAGLVYSRTYVEAGKARIEFSLIKLVKEGAAWKFDGAGSSDSPKVDDKGKPVVFSESDFPLELAIDGRVRTPASEAKVVEIPAMLSVSSYGHLTEVFINGVKEGSVNDKSSSGYTSAGLKRGANMIRISIEKQGKESPFRPTVDLKILGKNGRGVQVFEYEAGKTSYLGAHDQAFMVDPGK